MIKTPTLLSSLAAFAAFAQKREVPESAFKNLPSKNYAACIHTADSILQSYDASPFDVVKKTKKSKTPTYTDGLGKSLYYYQWALSYQPGDKYATEQAEKLQVRMSAESDKNASDQYQKLISEADGFMKRERFTQAKTYYQKASTQKPTDPYPKEQLARIDQLGPGDAYAQRKEYLKAKELYREASLRHPADSIFIRRIVLMDTMIAKAGRDPIYRTMVEKGDEYYAKQSYSKAQFYYEDAVRINPNDTLVIQRYKESVRLAAEKGGKPAEKYEDAIRVADHCYEFINYECAKKEYERALMIKPGDVYATKRLQEVELKLKRK